MGFYRVKFKKKMIFFVSFHVKFEICHVYANWLYILLTDLSIVL